VLESAHAIIHGSSAGLTPAYAAPEMINGTVTSWSDQYSLAITYHQLRTGSMPFEKHISFQELIQIHLGGQLDLGKWPEAERTVIARATQPKPEERYPDCATMVRAWQKACGLPSNFEFEMAARSQSSGTFELAKVRLPSDPQPLATPPIEQATPT